MKGCKNLSKFEKAVKNMLIELEPYSLGDYLRMKVQVRFLFSSGNSLCTLCNEINYLPIYLKF